MQVKTEERGVVVCASFFLRHKNIMTLIDDILTASSFDQLESHGNYKEIAKQVYPDKCKHPQATTAFQKLVQLHEAWSKGIEYQDDSGLIKTNGKWVEYMGDSVIIDHGKNMQHKFIDGVTNSLLNYMPYKWECKTKITFEKRSVLLSGKSIPQEHVNWILSRLIEFCMLGHYQKGLVHMGLTPNTVFVVPETHGIAVTGFYHMTQIGGKVGTISAAYKNWYPASLFKNKEAGPAIDIRMCKSIAAYILGDLSGNGTALKRTHNTDFVNFLLKTHVDSKECFLEYRELLKKNFPNKFYHLNI